MWQVLSQEAELRCEDAQLEVHRQKSNGRTLVQIVHVGASRNSCSSVASGTKSKACRNPITEALVSGIVKGSASQIVTRALTWRREF